MRTHPAPVRRAEGWAVSTDGGERDLAPLMAYCEAVSAACDVPIPDNYPVVGKDAFRTATGVHAAAIIKAEKKGHSWLADRIYSGVPAGMFGRKQEICIGFMSGASNVNFYLKERGIPTSEALVAEILQAAKERDQILTDSEVMVIVDKHVARASA